MTVKDKKVYIAVDGKEFDSEQDALEYEDYLMKPKVHLVIEEIDSLKTIKFSSCCSTTAAYYMSQLKEKNKEYHQYSYRITTIVLDETCAISLS